MQIKDFRSWYMQRKFWLSVFAFPIRCVICLVQAQIKVEDPVCILSAATFVCLKLERSAFDPINWSILIQIRYLG